MLKRFIQFVGLIALLVPSVMSQSPLVTSVDAPGFTVTDMDRSVEFFTQVLTFQKISDVEIAGPEIEHLEGVFGARVRIVRMQLGEEQIELSQYIAPQGHPFPTDFRSNDRRFQHIAIIVSNMEQAYKRLREFKVPHASSGPQRLPDWNKNAGGIQAFYFRDPDGHFLEVLSFPPDKGATKWHQDSKLFLGIDHTAIVVGNTDLSLHFYRDMLGMKVVGNSENYGTEQEHLNNVFGARLRITTLHAEHGPGVELLEYLAPRIGSANDPEPQANDIAWWQTTVCTHDIAKVAHAVEANHVALVSSAVTTFQTENRLKTLIIRDPDGHAFQFIEK